MVYENLFNCLENLSPIGYGNQQRSPDNLPIIIKKLVIDVEITYDDMLIINEVLQERNQLFDYSGTFNDYRKHIYSRNTVDGSE